MDGPNSSPTNAISALLEENNSNNSSLTLSLTPPLSEAPQRDTSTISEHLSSIENDRSMQEIEVTNLGENFSFLLQQEPSVEERLSQEPIPALLNSSDPASSISVEKLNRVNTEARNHAQSILQEILRNDQFKSESESKEESFNIFANLDLEDKLLNSYNCQKNVDFNVGSLKNDSSNNSYDDVCKRVRDFEELITIKDTTIAALTSELDSFREMISNTSTNSLGTTTTEYKQLQEECHNRLVEYHNAIVHKEEQIEKLANSLQQSILNREEMKQELGQLQEQLDRASNLLKHYQNTSPATTDFNEFCLEYENNLDSTQHSLFNALKDAFHKHVEHEKQGLTQEINALKDTFDREKTAQTAEIARLNELLANDKPEVLELKGELDAKHSKEMEELRTYFEKKCADLEKNYSEEVFSQQSRKMSGSSLSSDSELSSDFCYNQPGPGGDTKSEYTRKDIVKMQQTLTQMLNLVNKFNLNEITDSEFEKLKAEINKFDLKSLMKYDLSLVRTELQNKYHAELEILREDFDNKVDEINLEQEKKLKSLEKKYWEETEDLNVQLRGRISTTAQQEVVNSGEFEIDEVVQSYERRLQEQVTLAKIDIITALESQIQRLAASDSIDEDWPEELLQLKARFCERFVLEISRLNSEHAAEIARLKEEHTKTLNSALERAKRRSLRDADSLSKGEIELLKERDLLKRQTLALRNLLGELIKYFTQCEDELNNTLVEELLTKNLTQIEKELENSSSTDSSNNVKRVHITPNFDDLINLIDNSVDNDLESIDLKSELGLCLQKLKADANAILAFSTSFGSEAPVVKNDVENEITSLKRKLVDETRKKNELSEQFDESKCIIHTLEGERESLENQIRELLERQKILDCDLLDARAKISELIENGHKEIVSEGYGENGDGNVKSLAEAVASLDALQEKVRNLTEHPGNVENNALLLIEELVRAADKIVGEARREKDDFQQQAEHLERQLRDMSQLFEATERRCKEAEEERKEAVDKIYELRDIIRELEDQVKSKSNAEEELRNIVNELEVLVKHQSSEEANRPKEVRDVSDLQRLHQYVEELEGEVQKLRLCSEIAGSEGALEQIKKHLCDFEITLDKRTKDLEGLHSSVSATTCSSPSEDMSVRDVIHQDQFIYDECEVPLQQLARLKEKLLRHSRAEDAAVKRLRDLEMQILALKSELEEAHNERELLKKQNSDHLVLISNLQIRLDEQRIRAEHIEKQTNTSLEVQNYDLKTAIATLEEKIAKRDKTISQLKVNIEETRKHLAERERELSEPDDLVIQMQEQLELMRSENLKLKSKVDVSDVEKLKARLSDAERQLDAFASLNLDQQDIDSLNKLKLSGLSFRDVDLEQARRAKNSGDDLKISPIVASRKAKNNATQMETEPEFSSIEKLGSPKWFYSLQVPQQKANSTEKHVRFEDEVGHNSKVAELQNIVLEKDKIIQDYESRLEKLRVLQERVERLESDLEQTEDCLKKATESFEEEQKVNMRQLDEKEEQLILCRQKLEERKKLLSEKENELKGLQKLKNSLKMKENESKSHEETLKLQNEELKNLQELVQTLKVQNTAIIGSKDSEITKLKLELEDVRNELAQLQTLLEERNKVIDQMTADSKSLHINLETIQSKLQETGNVVDLGRRLREEQKKNSDLYEEIHELKAQLLGAGNRKSIEDIADQVQKELNYSTYLDSTLISAVSDSSLESEDVEALKLTIKRQNSINKQLIKGKDAVERKLENLEGKYETLKKELDRTQYEAAMLIGELRTKLEAAVNNETQIRRMLQVEKINSNKLEGQLNLMKNKVTMLDDSSVSLPNMSNHEYKGLTRMISTLEEENRDLKREISSCNDLTKLELDSKSQEITRLVSALSEVRFKEQMMTEKLARLTAVVEMKNDELTKNKKLMEEMENDRLKLIKQLGAKGPQKSKSSDNLPEQLLAKIQELNKIVKNEREMMKIIEKLRYENGVLEERLTILGERRNNVLPFDDPSSRANYLFAKYLRSESYRKALVWQKRYLICLLESYQQFEPFQFNPTTVKKKAKRRSQGIRFKCVAVMIVSICRMKFLVRRWHSGKRITEQRMRQQQQTVQFQVGQPVSSQNFALNAATSALNEPKPDMPWFGTSPPSKEPLQHLHFFRTQIKRTEEAAAKVPTKRPNPSSFPVNRETSTHMGVQKWLSQDSTLVSPAMLSKYMERFDQIQEKLGLDTFL